MLQVKELANTCRVSTDAVRYYTRIGLLQPKRDDLNGYKLYASKDVNRLRFIRWAKYLGYTLNEIKEILAHADKGHLYRFCSRNCLEKFDSVPDYFIHMVKHSYESSASSVS